MDIQRINQHKANFDAIGQIRINAPHKNEISKL